MAPPSVRGNGGLAHVPVLLPLVLLILAASLAGCIQQPEHSLQLRQGDLMKAHVVAANETMLALPVDADGRDAEELCGAPLTQAIACPAAERAYSIGPVPANLPPGYEDVTPLPAALASEVSGASPGDRIFLEEAKPWGPHRENLVEEHAIKQDLPRIVDDGEAYGISWTTRTLDDGSHWIMPAEDANGTVLSIERWCNERFCLFESMLTGYNETHLHVEHQPSEGDRVHVGALDTSLTVTNTSKDTFTVDGNHQHAGATFRVLVHIESARGPPSQAQRATGFQAQAVNGGTVALDELIGDPIVLEFFATWCPSCEENAKHLNRVQDRFGDEVRIVSIGVDPWEEGASFERFIKVNDVSWPVIVDEDGSLARAYSVGALSTGVIVDPDGFIVHTETGVADHDRVVGVLEDLVGETTSAHADEVDA